MKKLEKKKALVIFTIHNLIIPEPSSDAFQIEWKRGSNKGYTEKMIPVDCAIIYEKKFRCNATFLATKDKKCLPKILECKALHFPGASTRSKIIGKLYLDLTIFLSTDSALTSTFTLDSPHQKKSTITITTAVKFLDSISALKGNLVTDCSLNSATDVLQLTTDHESSWDVSMVTSDEQNSRIKEFFSDQTEKKKEFEKKLQDFIEDENEKKIRKKKTKKSPKQPKPPPLLPLPNEINSSVDSTNSLNLLNDNNTNSNSNSNNCSDCNKDVNSPSKQNKGDESAHKLTNFLTPKMPNSKRSRQRKKSNTNKEMILLKKNSGFFLTFQAVSNLTRSVLQYSWDRTPVPLSEKSYPKPASAIFAVLLHTQVLNSSAFRQVYFETIADLFFTLLNEKKFVFQCTESDCFVVSVHLLALLNIPLDFDSPRLAVFNTRLFDFTMKSFSDFVEYLLYFFRPFFNQMFSSTDTFDPDSAILTFKQCMSDANKAINIEDDLVEYVDNYLYTAIDSKLVDYLLKDPNLCAFSNSVSWNSFITMITADLPQVSFINFREALSILMVANRICSDPKCCNEIAKNLSKNVVYKILKNQVPDEFILSKNDTSLFLKYFEKDVNNDCIEFDVPKFNELGEVVSLVNTKNWMNINFTEQDKLNFSYLGNVFSNV